MVNNNGKNPDTGLITLKGVKANHKPLFQLRVDLYLLLHLFVDISYILCKRYYPRAVTMFVVVPDNKFDHIS